MAPCDTRAQDAVLHFLADIKEKLNTMSDSVDSRLAALEGKLSEASAEILAELATLRTQAVVTTEGLATLDRLEAKANALADVSPPIA